MTNQTELTAERVERAIAIQQELMRDMRSDDVDEENRETAEEVAVIVETVVLPVLRAEQERQWISVEDKLPADGMNILVANIKTGNQYVSHKDLVYFDTDHNACVPTSYFQTFVFTHWMPLPKPPAHCGRLLTEWSAE